MEKRIIPTGNDGRTVTLYSIGNMVYLGLSKPPTFSNIEVCWEVDSKEVAESFVKKATVDVIRTNLSRLAPFAGFVKGLEEALSNANTKTAIKPDHRVNGSYASRRNRV